MIYASYSKQQKTHAEQNNKTLWECSWTNWPQNKHKKDKSNDNQYAMNNPSISINNAETVEEVDGFTYFGSIVINNNGTPKEIK